MIIVKETICPAMLYYWYDCENDRGVLCRSRQGRLRAASADQRLTRIALTSHHC